MLKTADIEIEELTDDEGGKYHHLLISQDLYNQNKQYEDVLFETLEEVEEDFPRE